MRQRDVPLPTGVRQPGRQAEQTSEQLREAIFSTARKLHQYVADRGRRHVSPGRGARVVRRPN